MNLINENLFIDNLSGTLLKVQGFRSTICNVYEKDYVINKINGTELPEVNEVQKNLKNLTESVSKLIVKLRPIDFELLIDLIFRDMGCQRVGVIGGPQKTKDIELLSPLTQERYLVQVKSEANLASFKEYKQEFLQSTDYDKFFFIVHSPDPGLEDYLRPNDNINLWKMRDIARYTIDAGLINWIINKVG